MQKIIFFLNLLQKTLCSRQKDVVEKKELWFVQCKNTMKIIWGEDDSYRDHDRQEGLDEVLDRRSWKRESLKDLELWESLKIWKFWKRKGFNEEDDSLYLYVILTSRLTAQIKRENLILRQGFDFKTWRQSLKQTWRIINDGRDVNNPTTLVFSISRRNATRQG